MTIGDLGGIPRPVDAWHGAAWLGFPNQEDETMSYYDDRATDRAVAAYHRFNERNDLTPMNPNHHDTERVGDIVFIRSGGRLLARYRLKPNGSVRRIRDRASA